MKYASLEPEHAGGGAGGAGGVGGYSCQQSLPVEVTVTPNTSYQVIVGAGGVGGLGGVWNTPQGGPGTGVGGPGGIGGASSFIDTTGPNAPLVFFSNLSISGDSVGVQGADGTGDLGGQNPLLLAPSGTIGYGNLSLEGSPTQGGDGGDAGSNGGLIPTKAPQGQIIPLVYGTGTLLKISGPTPSPGLANTFPIPGGGGKSVTTGGGGVGGNGAQGAPGDYGAPGTPLLYVNPAGGAGGNGGSGHTGSSTIGNGGNGTTPPDGVNGGGGSGGGGGGGGGGGTLLNVPIGGTALGGNGGNGSAGSDGRIVISW